MCCNTCSFLSEVLVVPKDVQRMNFPSGSCGRVIDARQVVELHVIDDGIDDISCQSILNVNNITIIGIAGSFNCPSRDDQSTTITIGSTPETATTPQTTTTTTKPTTTITGSTT